MNGEAPRGDSRRSRDHPREDRREDRRDRRDRDRDRDRESHTHRERERDPERDRDRGDRDRRERRRSRSPYRANARPREGEQDPYSSSRNHRDREREDRYAGATNTRRDREWDRDRGGRYRRDDEEQQRGGGRRERDPFEDRRRVGGRGDRGERERERERERDRDRRDQEQLMNRPRSESPPKKREPTPDLTDVIPILERKRRLTQWDIKPPGYENVAAEQAKLSGMFPLPGAPRQQTVDASRLQAFMNQPSNQATSTALRPTNSRQAKRLIAYNLSPSVTEESVVSFFNLQLNGLNVMYTTDPCVAAQISRDRSFAVIEFKSSSDATLALAFDGISMDPDEPMEGDGEANGTGAAKGMELKRPKDYIVPAVVNDPSYLPGVVSNMVVDSVNKISITNIPAFLTDDQVTELLVAFGELKSFVLVKDSTTEESRGIAFCEFTDPAVTDIALSGLDGMDVAGKKLKVQKASIGLTQVPGIEMGVNAMSLLAGTTSTETEETRVLQLLNMVTTEELMDDDDFAEIVDDVKDECSKFGTVLDVQIPRPSVGARQAAGVGKIFVKFETKEEAKKALQTLAGRKFSDRTVVTTYFPEENFEVGAW